MRFIRLAIDKQSNAVVSLYEDDIDKMYRLYKRLASQDKPMFEKQYESVKEAVKAFDKQVIEDYYQQGLYYTDFSEAE